MMFLQKQYIFLHKMVQELINQNYIIKNANGESVYENVTSTIYQNVQPKNPVYENAEALK